MIREFYYVILFFFLTNATVNAQGKIAGKSNLLYDATTTLNLGIEIGTASQWSLDISGNYNPWQFSNDRKLKHWLVQPEMRYWFCEKFNGHFLGVHVHYGEYNVSDIKFIGTEDFRYEGNLVGGGVTYGYQWVLNKRWNLEAALGLGYARLDHEKFECGKCGQKVGDFQKNYFGPTKLAVSIIYIIK